MEILANRRLVVQFTVTLPDHNPSKTLTIRCPDAGKRRVTQKQRVILLSHDALLVRYMSSCVRLFVCQFGCLLQVGVY